MVNFLLQKVCVTQGSNLKLGNFMIRFLVSDRSFKLGFTFVYMFSTFKLLPQLKIGEPW